MASTKLFHTLSNIRAESTDRVTRPTKTLAEARGYNRRDLAAIAEMGYHYLRCGGYKLAVVIFEGLLAIDPRDAYFALALGLAAEHLGDLEKAASHYQHAARLDPSDGRPEINLAEIELQWGRTDRALLLLQSGSRKARARHDAALETKANALASLVARTRRQAVKLEARS